MSMNPATEKRTCPSGHTLIVSEFKSHLKLDVPDITDAVIFECPGGARGHQFTLRKAVGSGMFNIQEANMIANAAYRERGALRKREG